MSMISDYANSMSATNTTGSDKYNELKAEDFLKLIVAELQNQDPLNPMDNTQMITQISQIRSITSNDQLSSTLESVALSQNVAFASSMLGKTIAGTDSSGAAVSGVVDRIVLEAGLPTLYVGNQRVNPSNVAEIQ